MKTEIEILMKVDHPNIVKYYGTYEGKVNLHIVMELCTGRTLQDELEERGCFSENECKSYFKAMLNAINYLHSKAIVHRDIKPENFIFESRDRTCKVVKLLDFGLATKKGSEEGKAEIVGSPYFISPEMIKGSYDKKSDMWSLGVMLFVFLSGWYPFMGQTEEELF